MSDRVIPEREYIRPCPICASSLKLAFDFNTEDLKVTPESLPPLARDRVSVVSAYKRLKGLGGTWDRQHGARAIVYAGTLLEAVGFQGGQLDRALGLMDWLKASGSDWSLDSAAGFFKAYEESQRKAKASLYTRCDVCGELFTGIGKLCERHDGE